MTTTGILSLTRPDLIDILDEKRLTARFQSILSARNSAVIGFEGLIRGVARDGTLIPPSYLFAASRQYDLSLELDRLCRDVILEAFVPIHRTHPDILLFLNLETSFLSSSVVGSGHFMRQIARQSLPPSVIVLEIVESRTEDIAALMRFVHEYRELGLNIALDDVGAGYSNFDRISLIQPHIIKIDRSIISDMASDYFKQEIFKTLISLSKNIGCLALAEGVETRNEGLCVLEHGADMMQGYFFSRPESIAPPLDMPEERELETLLSDFRAYHVGRVQEKRKEYRNYQKAMRDILARIRGRSVETIISFLQQYIDEAEGIDAVYLVGSDGCQVTDTIMKKNRSSRSNSVFRAASRAESLAHKDYVYQLLSTDLRRFATDHYISFATGKLCVTLSCLLRSRGGEPCILCVDFLVPEDRQRDRVCFPGAPDDTIMRGT